MKIYLDNAATTPMHPDVIEKMVDAMNSTYGNPSSIHQFGRQAKGKLEQARATIAASIHAKENEIFFTSGGTEGDNTVILQTAFQRKKEGKHLITTQVEHHAVLHTMEFLETQGFEVTYLPVDEHGNLAVEAVKNALRDDTILVSIMFGNNETGNRFPIKEIGALLRDHSAYFHTDAVQAYGIENLDVIELGVDFLTTSGHKINGPKGTGFFYLKEGILLPSLLHGGEQEEKRRPGTENIPGILGFQQAVEILTEKKKAQHKADYQQFTAVILQKLAAAEIAYQINGNPQNSLPHVLNLWLQDIPNDILLLNLDLQGIAISTGSACTAGSVEPSHVLTAIYGADSAALKESIRISYGAMTTRTEIEEFANCLVKTVHQLKK